MPLLSRHPTLPTGTAHSLGRTDIAARATIAILALVMMALGTRAALPTPDPDNGGIELPPGFRALVVADDLVAGRKVGRSEERLRFLAVTPSGDVYAKTYLGGIFALRDSDGDGRLETVKEFGQGGGTGIALHEGWLYHSTNSAVYRYRLAPGELVPSAEPEPIVTGLPDEKNTHNAKSFAFDGAGRLLVEVGSPFNVYSEHDRQRGAHGLDATDFLKTHGGFWRFDANRPNQTLADGFHFSTGHRHSLALAWHPVAQQFFMAQMGRDQLNTVDPAHYDELDNAERVAEEFHLLREGINLGWPYSYWDPYKKARMLAPEFGGDGTKRADNPEYDQPLIAFPAHWAPLQMAVYTGTQFPAKYRNGIFIAFHGSWNRAPLPQEGYNITFVPFDANGMPVGTYEVFARGFPQHGPFSNPREARYHPGGVAVGPDGSLFVSDTDRGRIWRIIYTDETNGSPSAVKPVALAEPEQPAPAVNEPDTPGRRIYVQICAACHMPDGSGVSGMQPPLIGSAIAAGDPAQLIRVILRGPAAVLPADRPKFGNVMPAFAPVFSDQQVADIATYVRKRFGNSGSSVSASDVATQRAASPSP